MNSIQERDIAKNAAKIKKNVVVFIDTDYEKVIKNNYTFNLRIKSNLDNEKILAGFSLNYVKLSSMKLDDILKNEIFIFYKAQFFLSSVRMIVNVLKKLNKKVIFDIDDYYLDVPSYSFSSHLNHGKRLKNFKKNLRKSDNLVVSTEFLGQCLSSYNANIRVIPNTIDSSIIKEFVDIDKQLNILITSSDNLKIINFKDDFISCLMGLKKKYQDKVKFIFLGRFANIVKLNEIADECIDKMSSENYCKYLEKENIHLGLVPLGAEEDQDTFVAHCCKSNIKFLEFSKYGILGIYSKLEPYKDVEDMKDGILVSNTKCEWLQKISELVDSPDLIKGMVSKSQKKLKDKYSKSISSSAWFLTLDGLDIGVNEELGIFLKSRVYAVVFIIRLRYNYNKLWQKMLFVLMLIKKRNFKEIYLRIRRILFLK